MRVAIWGSTGTAGSELLRQCVSDVRIEHIVAFARRPPPVEDARVEPVIVRDFSKPDELRGRMGAVDAAFWCLGVSQSAVPQEDRYREITRDYTLVAARALLEQSPGASFHFMSGSGADPSGRSWMMWARVKGETENALGELDLSRLTIWRPGYIHAPGGPEHSSFGQRVAASLAPMLGLFPGAMNPTVEIAHAMLVAAFDPAIEGLVSSKGIAKLARRYDGAAAA